MEQLVEAYHEVIALPEFREMIRQRERARHNEASALANAERKGEIKGERKGRREFVLNMREAGFGVADIAKATKLSERKVNDILGGAL